MKLVFFCAGGELALRPLEAAAPGHQIAAVVRPAAGSRLKRTLKRAAEAAGLRLDPIAAWVSRTRTPSLAARSGSDPDLIRLLRQLEPDLICIATFPSLLGHAAIETARYGAINIHPSLLPRHRGPNPYFWTYYRGDHESGVTIHQATSRADAGPILHQEAFQLPRGESVERLHAGAARLGASLLQHTLERFDEAARTARPQDERLATPAPRVKPGVPMVDYAQWDVSQVWHFLAGLHPHHLEPLSLDGKPIAYHAVLGYETAAQHGSSAHVGMVERAPHGWNLHCQGGFVKLASRRAARLVPAPPASAAAHVDP